MLQRFWRYGRDNILQSTIGTERYKQLDQWMPGARDQFGITKNFSPKSDDRKWGFRPWHLVPSRKLATAKALSFEHGETNSGFHAINWYIYIFALCYTCRQARCSCITVSHTDSCFFHRPQRQWNHRGNRQERVNVESPSQGRVWARVLMRCVRCLGWTRFLRFESKAWLWARFNHILFNRCSVGFCGCLEADKECGFVQRSLGGDLCREFLPEQLRWERSSWAD